ncbi:hypothetical protein DPMN_148239 [Dreissena polymorpha]|uniref:Uncharacterized protein n=1 Tax=Dreissena polymorpha TaxID=45954 RepID=A0A9D4FBC8_DREPO|nr:hypothetical protein DPMN_148239 [Dreissena polymorpha]
MTSEHPGSHVFQHTRNIFIHIQNIIQTNILTKFLKIHESIEGKIPRPPPPGGHVFQATGTIFELVQDIIRTNRLTKKNAPPPAGHFREDWTINVTFIVTNARTLCHNDRTINLASRVITRKNAPPTGSHVFQPIGTIFELVQDIIGTNLFTKFYDERTINVASRVLTRKKASPPGGHVLQATGTIFELSQDIMGTNPLT